MRVVGALIVLACWLGAQTLQAAALRDRRGWPPEHEYVLLPPPSAAPYVAAGYRELGADILWARALVYYGGAIKQADGYRYLESFIDNILALDPQFKRVYRWAASAVTYRSGTATEEEFRSSVRYLEKAMIAFPDEYEFFWHAGIRYFFDLRPDDPALRQAYRERGAQLMEQAMRKPDAPEDLATTAASFRTHLGQQERARQILEQKLLTTEDPAARDAMLARFRYLADQSETDELLRVTRRFSDLKAQTLPDGPPGLFILLGPRPDPVIDFADLATDRDLIGAEDSGEIVLFPRRARLAAEPADAEQAADEPWAEPAPEPPAEPETPADAPE